jgi:glycosyltransferase involved in cell wall biosynthesis
MHVSSSSLGGAGIAAVRLSEAQKNAGNISKFINVQEIENANIEQFSIIKRQGVSATQRLLTKRDYGVITPISFPYLPKKLIEDFNPNIIHIHNWYNLLDYRLIEHMGRSFPLVLTMHDERLITGGCHNSLGCDNYLTGCHKCPATYLLRRKVLNDYQIKKDLFQKIPKYSITTPSMWMLGKAIESKLFLTAKEIKKISNIVPTQSQVGKNKSSNDKQKTFKILFVAADLNVKLKGFDLLINAFLQLTESNPNLSYSLTAIGSKIEKIDRISVNSEVVYKPAVTQSALRLLFAESSILVVPSLSENAPNIIIEAQSSGLIVLATDVDGIPELIRDAETGFLTQCDSHEIARNIKRIQNFNQESLSRIREIANYEVESNNSALRIEQEFMDLYLKTIDANI